MDANDDAAHRQPSSGYRVQSSFTQCNRLRPSLCPPGGGRSGTRRPMKALLAYDASPTVRAIIAAADRAAVEIVHIAEDDDARYTRELADADVLLHVLAP